MNPKLLLALTLLTTSLFAQEARRLELVAFSREGDSVLVAVEFKNPGETPVRYFVPDKEYMCAGVMHIVAEAQINGCTYGELSISNCEMIYDLEVINIGDDNSVLLQPNESHRVEYRFPFSDLPGMLKSSDWGTATVNMNYCIFSFDGNTDQLYMQSISTR